MLRTTRITFDHQELRRDRRYELPPVTLSVGGTTFAATNWSLGGLLLAGGPEIAVGERLHGSLQVTGHGESFPLTTQAVRRDETALACRFVDPSLEMVGALDRAVMRRRAPKHRAALGLLALLAGSLVSLPALAAGVTPVGMLVPGGAPLPEFRLEFPSPLAGPPALAPGNDGDLEISLTSADRSVLHFLFSPRPQLGMDVDRETGVSRSFAGLSWNVFDNAGFYGNLGLAGSLTRSGPEELNRRLFGAPLALHSSFEFGYQIGNNNSLSLSVDHASTPDFLNDRNELNNLRLRYGLKF